MGVILCVLLGLGTAVVARVMYLLCKYALHPSSVADSAHLPPHEQHELTAPEGTPLLRGTGTHGGGLREPGWARQLQVAYARSQARLWAPLVKEWDYYCCLDDEFVAVFALFLMFTTHGNEKTRKHQHHTELESV